METLRIGSFHARYRLPRSERATRERLDRLLAEMLDERLEGALAAAGVDATEEVCVRRVDAPVRVRLAAADSAVADGWASAVAGVIAAVIGRGGPGVVRYGSRRHALLDLVLGVARGRTGRAWAWRQLGLWPADDLRPGAAVERAELALAQLRAEPAAVVPVLAAAAREDAEAVAELLALAGAAAWRALAEAALAAAGLAPAALAGAEARPGGAREPERDGVSVPDELRAVAAGSRVRPAGAPAEGLARAAAEALVRSSGDDPSEVAALAVLVVLAADPAPRGVTAFGAAVHAAAAELRRIGTPGEAATTGLEAPDRVPGTRTGRSETGRRAWHADGRESHAPPEPEDDRSAAATRSAADDVDGEEAAVPPRVSGETRAGGLLYLLNVVDELGVVEELPEDRSLRWSLHAVALLLAPIERDDPAALAFCGLAPDAEPPDERALPPSPAETTLLEAAAARTVARAAELLDPEADPDELLASLVSRPAEIVADPGWLDVRLRLDDVSTELRRSGLDLDPGWLPWLGCVVRFVYV